MTSLREQIGKERDRLVLVRKSLTASLDQTTPHGPEYVPFYVAVAKYIEASMGRLHAQDMRMGELLPERAAGMDAEVKGLLRDVEERLEGSRKNLQALAGARQVLEAKGASALKNFEAVARTYTEYIRSRMGHQKAPSDLAMKLFTEADWTYMAGATPQDIALEQQLYDRVLAAIPPGVKAVPG